MADISLYGRLPGMEAYRQQNIDKFRQRKMQDEALAMQQAQAGLGERKFEFTKEQAERDFQLRKQAVDMQRGLLGMKQQKLQMEMNQPQMPFEGNSEFAQVGNELYRYGIEQGIDPVSARRQAIDRLNQSKQDLRLDPMTGQFQFVPRQPIFNAGQGQEMPQGMMPPMQQGMPQEVPQQQGGVNLQLGGDMPPEYGPEQTVFDALGTATGPRMATGGVQSALNALTFGSVPVDEAYETAKITVDNAKGMLRAFAENHRFPEGERKAIESRVEAFERSVLKGPDAARVQALSLDNYLMQLRRSSERSAENNSLHVNDRRGYRRKVNDIDQLREYMFGVGPGEKFNVPKRGKQPAQNAGSISPDVQDILRGYGIE